ncbi:MAG: Stealth CR1 domain-containing protein [Pseudomonadota bacterium]
MSEGAASHSDTDAASAIDAVVLWVDGNDPRHRAKLDAHLTALGRRPISAAPTRFGSVGEIDYCLTSLLRFAPFLRLVHVVTDEQWPALMRQPGASPLLRKLVRVDHREVFRSYEDCLPSFSSRSIETMLHRVPGLAARFIYLNDDFMLIKPTNAAMFFDGDRPLLRGRWRVAPERRLTRRMRALWQSWRTAEPPAQRPNAGDAQAMAARLVGVEGRFFSAAHAPYCLRRDTLAHFFDAHPELLRQNIEFRLRDSRQFTTTSLANHLELRGGHAIVESDARLLYVKPKSQRAVARQLLRADTDPQLVFACIQSLDEADAGSQACVLDWLDRTIGRAPPT